MSLTNNSSPWEIDRQKQGSHISISLGYLTRFAEKPTFFTIKWQVPNHCLWCVDSSPVGHLYLCQISNIMLVDQFTATIPVPSHYTMFGDRLKYWWGDELLNDGISRSSCSCPRVQRWARIARLRIRIPPAWQRPELELTSTWSPSPRIWPRSGG